MWVEDVVVFKVDIVLVFVMMMCVEFVDVFCESGFM